MNRRIDEIEASNGGKPIELNDALKAVYSDSINEWNDEAAKALGAWNEMVFGVKNPTARFHVPVLGAHHRD